MSITSGTAQVPAGTANSTDITLLSTAVGSKADTAVTTVGTTTSLMAYVKGILNRINALRKAATTGTHAHANNVNEQTILTATAPATGSSITMNGMTLDMTNCTQNKVIRVYIQVDGTNYRLAEAITWVTTDNPAVRLAAFTTARSYSIRIQSAVLEGAPRNIPYEYAQEG